MALYAKAIVAQRQGGSMYEAPAYSPHFFWKSIRINELYEQFWGDSSSLQTTEFEVKVPQPQFYLDSYVRGATGFPTSAYRDIQEGGI